MRLAVRAASAQGAIGTIALTRGAAPMTGSVLKRHFAQQQEPTTGTVTPGQARELYGRTAKVDAS